MTTERVIPETKSPAHPYDPEKAEEYLKEESEKISGIIEGLEGSRATQQDMLLQFD